MNEILLSLSGASNDRLLFRMRQLLLRTLLRQVGLLMLKTCISTSNFT